MAEFIYDGSCAHLDSSDDETEDPAFTTPPRTPPRNSKGNVPETPPQFATPRNQPLFAQREINIFEQMFEDEARRLIDKYLNCNKVFLQRRLGKLIFELTKKRGKEYINKEFIKFIQDEYNPPNIINFLAVEAKKYSEEAEDFQRLIEQGMQELQDKRNEVRRRKAQEIRDQYRQDHEEDTPICGSGPCTIALRL